MNPSLPNQYDPANARFLAGVAAAAYRDDAGAAWLAECGFRVAVIDAPHTETRALIACDSQDCVVAFRGTQDLRNWLTDLDCAFAHLGKSRVHRGFHQALESVREDVAAEIQGLHYQRLWFSGHSLGGALAMLGADAWDGAVEGVYTFGQPRAGDAAFCREYNERLGGRTFRLIHADDLVPRVPWVLGAYRHAGHEVFFPSPVGKGRGEEMPLLDRPFWTRLPGEIRRLAREFAHGQLALLEDHHINHYLALLAPPAAEVSQSFPLPPVLST